MESIDLDWINNDAGALVKWMRTYLRMFCCCWWTNTALVFAMVPGNAASVQVGTGKETLGLVRNHPGNLSKQQVLGYYPDRTYRGGF